MLSPAELEALRLSLQVAGVAMMVGLPLAIGVAWLLAHKDFPGKSLLDAIVHAPLVLPPVIVGYLLLLAFSPVSPLGKFLDSIGMPIAFSWRGAALASLVMAFPLMVRAIRLSFEAQDPRLAFAARSLGASRWRAFFTVTLPLASPGLITGTLLGFARALGEFGATIVFVANIPGLTQTIPLAIFSAVQSPGGEAVALRLMVVSLLLAFVAIYLSNRFSPSIHHSRSA